ncbi:MAG TPA: hypothetical protein VK507_17945 [Iamia sp.]|nr:hypothetical protein [Iamia sp.]
MSPAGVAAVPVPDDADPQPAAAPQPVSSGAAVVLLVAGVVVAALVSVSVARLIPFDADDSPQEAAQPVPVEPAGAVALEGVAPAVTFDGAGPALPDGALGSWSTEAGAWTVDGGAARPTDTAEDGALAVVTAPEGSSIAQVTLRDPTPGAGLVVSYRDPDSYIALQVGRTGRTVQLVEVDGRPRQPRVLVVADLTDPTAPLVLAVRRHLGGYEGVANGYRIGHRGLEEDDEPVPWRVGLVSGVRPDATTTTFDDLVVGG